MKKKTKELLDLQNNPKSAQSVWTRSGLVLFFVITALLALVLAVTLYLPRG